MTPSSADLFSVAERLDESPTELLNGGAADALRLLKASVPETEAVARTRGIDPEVVNALWERASARLRDVPEPSAVFPAAAEAAALLYTAAWVLDSDSLTAEDLKAAM
jgi:hypothetical protein